MFLLSDTMISTTDMSADFLAFKIDSVGKHWAALYAGDEISSVTPLIRKVTKSLKGETLEDVTRAFTEAFQDYIKSATETEILGPIGYSREDFKTSGLAQLGPEAFARLLYEIQQYRIDAQFLVAGFDGNAAHIFTVTSPGKITYYTEIGFWAIGSGQTNALGSLFNSGSLRFQEEEDCFYRVCEAKFNAETAIGVGRETAVAILYQDGLRTTTDFAKLRELKKKWESTKTTIVPLGAKTVAITILKEAKEAIFRPQESESEK